MRALQLLVVIVALAFVGGIAHRGAEVAPPALAKPGQYTDKALYRDVAARIAAGDSYYAAAATLHRAHGYPLKPSFTVRLPTLSIAAAWFGWARLKLATYALMALTAIAWLFALNRRAHWSEGLLAAAAIAGGVGMLGGDPVILHERWAGLFLSLALALRIGWPTAWPGVIALAALALSVRELALPFALLALAFALWSKRWREAAAWAGLMGLFGGLFALHLQAVAAQVVPGDLATQGWGTEPGITQAVKAVIFTSPLQYLPAPLAIPLAVLPLAGWLGLGWRRAAFCLLLFGGYALMFAVFARSDTFYWGAIVQPAWFVGLAFLPRLVLRLYDAGLDKRRSAPNLASLDARL